MDVRSLLIVLLSLAGAGGFAYYIIYPFFSGETQGEKRQAQLAARRVGTGGSDRQSDAANRRKQVAESLKELEQRSAKQRKVSLELRISQAGLSLTKQNYYIASAFSAALTALMLFITSGNPYFGLAGVIIGGVGLPSMWLSSMTKRRLKKFTLAFPGAVDVIIRGVKAGLPLGDCLRIIAAEAPDPVRGEFRQIVEAQQIGLSVSEAVERLPDRIPTPEANFFAIVISIQQKAGGNLGEALANLSRVLRERKKMADKVKAMSSEAKASAYIIGALPLVVMALVYLTSPHYMEMLWTTDTGRVTMVCCAAAMGLGSFIMSKMIQFDI